MPRATDIQVDGASLYFLPITLRVPLKFGAGTVTSVTCARVAMRVRNEAGKVALGWGETPLSVQWVWPSALSFEVRERALKDFCVALAKLWAAFSHSGHALEIGHSFIETALPPAIVDFNRSSGLSEPMPRLAALVCCSAFDIALHDAFGQINAVPIYDTYNEKYLNYDLARYLKPASSAVSFEGTFPADFFATPAPTQLRAWHLVGGLDPLESSDLNGTEPNDGYPVTLLDWIQRDGLTCLKIKLRGTDAAWDFERLVRVGRMAIAHKVEWLTADFNCTVTAPGYVTECLDRLMREEPRIYGMLLYVEQPFPYELEEHPIDVHAVSARKPLFLDESAHDWRMVELGRSLGWTGVALKTCKTQTGALLSLCWARAHGMTLMVQDLTNPMLAQIPHVLLAAHAGTIMGVETNGMQFYPEASKAEAAVHPGIYKRRAGMIDLSSVKGAGFGYRIAEIQRTLPSAVVEL